jgi:hypothetical protein
MQPSQFLSTNPRLLRNPHWRYVLLFPTAPRTLGVYDDSSDAVAPGATIIAVTSHAKKPERVFKTAWFTQAARKTHIADQELCAAIRRLMLGQGDDLGGGVFKERPRKNQYRCIILAKAGHYWVYEYLFAKQDRANIAHDELADFRKLVKAYATLTTHQINQLIREKDWTEICDGNET